MRDTKIDLSKYKNKLGRKHQIYRMIWNIVWILFARWIPRNMCACWKRFLLRMFGAKLAKSASVYSSAKVYYPANLIMKENTCIASDVDCYNVAPIIIGANTTISQGAFLCTASHDIENLLHPLITAPIHIEDQVWIGSRAYIGMGVTVKQGAVVGATASVYKDVEPWTVVGGNPAKFLKNRVIRK